jgi:RNase P subunit RPR2
MSLVELKWLGRITDYEHFSCPKCRSALIEQRDASNALPQDIQGRCRGCGAALSVEEVVELVVDAQYGAEAHFAAKDGGDDVISTCHECGQETYVSSQDGVNGCFWCECSLTGECAHCHIGLTPNTVSENNPALCGYCHNLFLKD